MPLGNPVCGRPGPQIDSACGPILERGHCILSGHTDDETVCSRPPVGCHLAGRQDTLEAEDFARSNILAIFCHEFGHALIDILDLPIYGREEDAADNAAVLLMEWLYDEATATQMVMDTADAFWVESWGEVFRALARQDNAAPGLRLEVLSGDGPLTAALLAEEIAAMNAAFALPQEVPVIIGPCDEAKAFYFPAPQSITMCAEFEPCLCDLFTALEE